MSNGHKAAKIFDKYVDAYEEQHMDVSLYADTLDVLCKLLKPEQFRLIELACGPGNVTRYLMEKLPELQVLATDLSANMVERAQQNNPRARVVVMDCRSIDNIDERFDVLVCAFGLPYLSWGETQKLLLDSAALLSTDGLLYLSTIADNYANSRVRQSSDGQHELMMYYYSVDELKELLNGAGFQIIECSKKHYKDTSGNLVKDVIIIARKK